jgi:hypothetical protein
MADGAAIQLMTEAAANAQATENDHIVIATERAFDRHPGRERLKYVRGSSGFAGFAKGGFSRARIEEFHANMTELMGERWREWGSEQCGSNFAVANSPGAVVLPYPQYTSFYPGVDVLKGKFFSFHRHI